MRKKVLFISHNGSVSGAPISLRILIDYFKQNTNWDIRVLLVRKGPLIEYYEKQFDSSVFYHICDFKKEFKHLRARRLKKSDKIWRGIKLCVKYLIQRKHQLELKSSYISWQPDLVYSNTAINGEEINYLNIPAPVIVHVRELNMALDTMSEKADRAFKNKPHHYLAVSNAVKRNLIARYDIKPERITIAPVALECDEVISLSQKSSEESIRGDFDIPKDAKIIGGIGYVNHRKGPDLFFDVAAKWVKNFPEDNTVFVWAGEGTDLELYRTRALEEGLIGKLKFIGLKKDIYPLIKMFNIFLMTSRDDPFPRVNLESGLLKTPVIAFTPSGGSCEYVEDDCGMCVDEIDSEMMYQKLQSLIGNENLIQEFGENGHEKVKRLYDISIVGSKVTNLIEKEIFNAER